MDNKDVSISKQGLPRVWSIMSLLALSLFASAQSSTEMRNIFTQAESHYLFEEYDLANQLYILLDNSQNCNVKYKIGTCYLHIPGEKEKAIPYLEAAIKDASYDAEPAQFREQRAPLDAYFNLAKAYMINNELEKALTTLRKFSQLAKATQKQGGMENLDYIDQQILACNNAITFRQNPVIMNKESLGSGFSQGSINDNPAVSFDGNSIVYSERRGMVNVILYSVKEKGKWKTPVEITQKINAGEDCSTCSLNSDGTLLFLYKVDNFDGNIYSSELVNGEWTPIKKLNKNVNTKFYESHASISADGKKLYFTSNRDGGLGGLDIYVSELDQTGEWGPAVNLGSVINTPYNEDTPFVAKNGSELYFSSEGHEGMGGFDNFWSQKTGTGWETPRNIGFPINTTDDDKFFQSLNEGKNAFYSMTTGYKKKEIFYLTFGNTISQTFQIRGKLSLQDTLISFRGNYSIHLLDRKKGDTLDVGFPNKMTGHYNFFVNPGSYKIIYTGQGYLPQTIDTTILQDKSVNIVTIDIILKKDPAATKIAEKIDLKKIPVVQSIDSSILIRNMKVTDINDHNIRDADVLYYAVQLKAMRNPLDIRYFKFITDVRVFYNEQDKLYRYITGQFTTYEEASEMKAHLIKLGYPTDLFIKKVSKR
jgi:hypothetical protein